MHGRIVGAGTGRSSRLVDLSGLMHKEMDLGEQVKLEVEARMEIEGEVMNTFEGS